MIWREDIELATPGRATLDVTSRIAEAVRRSGIRQGLCHLFCMHTSASLLITENADPDVRRDLETLMRRAAPDGDAEYRHDAEGPDDMSAHMRAVLTGTELTVPVDEGRLGLGTWQGIFLWEHRIAGQRRRLRITVFGE